MYNFTVMKLEKSEMCGWVWNNEGRWCRDGKLYLSFQIIIGFLVYCKTHKLVGVLQKYLSFLTFIHVRLFPHECYNNTRENKYFIFALIIIFSLLPVAFLFRILLAFFKCPARTLAAVLRIILVHFHTERSLNW